MFRYKLNRNIVILTKFIEEFGIRSVTCSVPNSSGFHRVIDTCSCCCQQGLNNGTYGDRHTLKRFKSQYTPHLKEQRDRHAKYVKNKKSGIDGHIPHQEEKEAPSQSIFGRPNEKDVGPGVEVSATEKLKQETVSLGRMYGIGSRLRKSTLKLSAAKLYYFMNEVVDPEFWFEELNLPDTFYSYFLLMELHVWFLFVRLQKEGTWNAEELQDKILMYLWEDMEIKMNKVPGAIPHKKKTLQHIFSHFNLAMLRYDEGLLGDDKDLAQAIWNTMFNSSEVDPEVLETLVMYIRKQVRHIDLIPSKDFLANGVCLLLPLYGDEVPLHLYRDISNRVTHRTSANVSFGGLTSFFGKKKTISSEKVEELTGLKSPGSKK